MNTLFCTPIRYVSMLLISTLLVTGCSGSGSSPSTLNDAGSNDVGSNGLGSSDMGTNDAGGNNSNETGTDSQLEPPKASLELVAVKTFRINWQSAAGAEFFRVLENRDGVSGFTQVSGDLDSTVRSYDHLVPLYKRDNARYIVQACNSGGCVDSGELSVSGGLAQAIGYFKASNSDPKDDFGRAIALSADGNTLAVGAVFEESAATGVNGDQLDNSSRLVGAVYVFERINGTWVDQAYLKPEYADEGDSFGQSVSLSADGNTLAIGSLYEDGASRGVNGDQSDNSAYGTGAVYLFVRNSGAWQQQAYFKASNTQISQLWSYGQFGYSVSLSADGNTLAVGDIVEASSATGINGQQFDTSARYTGAVYVFVNVSGNWRQQAYVKASNAGTNDYFGSDVALSADGNTMVVGASREGSSATGVNGDQNLNSGDPIGAAYVFVRKNTIDGTDQYWEQQAYLKSRNSAELEDFGLFVSISGDGDVVAVGAMLESDSMFFATAELFVRNNGNWQQQAYFKADGAASSYSEVGDVSLSADGKTLALGAGDGSSATGINGDPNDNSAENSGAVYIYENTDGSWQKKAYVKASNPDVDDEFGNRVFLSADGQTLAVGSPREDSAAAGTDGYQLDNSVEDSGAVYLF